MHGKFDAGIESGASHYGMNSPRGKRTLTLGAKNEWRVRIFALKFSQRAPRSRKQIRPLAPWAMAPATYWAKPIPERTQFLILLIKVPLSTQMPQGFKPDEDSHYHVYAEPLS